MGASSSRTLVLGCGWVQAVSAEQLSEGAAEDGCDDREHDDDDADDSEAACCTGLGVASTGQAAQPCGACAEGGRSAGPEDRQGDDREGAEQDRTDLGVVWVPVHGDGDCQRENESDAADQRDALDARDWPGGCVRVVVGEEDLTDVEGEAEQRGQREGATDEGSGR